jgi:molecular chaperone DnaK (HSP70)
MLNEARKKGYHKFDQIVLVGGATRMPQVTSRIGEEFSMEPRIFDPDEAVSKGAAIFGWKLFIQDGLIKRVAEKTGKEVGQIDEVSDEEVKTALDEAEEYVAKDTGFSVNDIKRSRMRIRNVTSKSFGVIAEDENEQEHVYNLILKNSTVPIITTSALGTTVENQDKAFIQIMENESSSRIASVDEALEISTAVLELPSGLKADSPIEITFKLNEEGRLEINAMEKTHKRVVTVSLETRSVIYGKDLEEAKERRKTITVS